MIIKNELHQLIQSMSRTEKRYFKVQAKKSGDEKSNYVRLFNAINTQDKYDEELIKKKFKKEKLSQNLNKEKLYLHKKILQSLRAYRTKKSADAQIKDMLIDIAYLIERSLYKQAEMIVKKAKKIGYQYQKYIALLEILDAERNVMNKLQAKNVNELILKNHQARNEVISILVQENEYQQLESELFSLSLTKFSLRTEEEHKKLDKYRNHPFFLNEDLPKSFHAKYNLYKAKGLFHKLCNEPQQIYESYQKALALFDTNSQQIEERLYEYRVLLSNSLYGCFATQQWNSFLPILQKINQIPAKNRDDEAMQFYQTHYNELLYYMNIADFDKATKLIKPIEEGLKKYANSIKASTRIGFYSNIGILFFIKQDWKEAQRWFYNIIKFPKSETRMDIQSQARLYNLIIEYELGNYDVLDDLHRSTSRFLKSRSTKYQLESVMLQELKQLFKQYNRTAKKKQLQRFETALRQLQNDPTEQNAPALEEFSLWVESKLANKTMEELMRRLL